VLKTLSSIIADTMGKPEQYVMAAGCRANLMLGGTADPAAYVEVKSIGGLSPAVNKKLSQKICAQLESALNIPSSRIYITFQSFEGDSWGHNGTTFA
jgi:Macrophage migration inhibitory factor (MIF).